MRFLARKAKKLARKWGGQCIVFIDEIDAVGMRRQALQGSSTTTPLDTSCQLYGPFGALNPSGDLIVESARVARAHVRRSGRPSGASPYPPWMQQASATSSTRGSSPG